MLELPYADQLVFVGDLEREIDRALVLPNPFRFGYHAVRASI